MNNKIITAVLLVLNALILNGCGNDSSDSGSPTIQPPVTYSYISFEPDWSHDVKQSLSYQQAKEEWKNFRKRFPYHIQTISARHFEQDDSYCLVLPEPPAHLSLAALKDFFDFYNAEIQVFEKKVGHDGWTKDAVVALTDISSFQFLQMIKKLNVLFFGTEYKSDLYLSLPFNERTTPFLRESLNFQVTNAELKSWFIDGEEKLQSLNGEDSAQSLSQLMLQGNTGVFISQKPGFVIWILQKSRSLNQLKEEIRRFTLDADLILGGISNPKYLAIIGRERSNNIYELPPLRTETILGLAAADQSELAQSYERNNLMAGKMPNGRDWAPIYLSDELLNTEYGSLLNLTDQMLKSWSSNGTISYIEWNHPKPRRWGFRRGGIMGELGINSVTFNWNTTGAAYAIPTDGFEIVALNRTGSLPITYIPGGAEGGSPEERILGAEEKGYNFFSSLNNPDLVRVVQYASLYQMFRQYGIQATNPGYNGNKPSTNPLLATYKTLFHTLQSFDASGLHRKIVPPLVNKLYSDDFAQMRRYGYSPSEIEEERQSLIQAHGGEIAAKLRKFSNARDHLLMRATATELADLAAAGRSKIWFDSQEELTTYEVLQEFTRELAGFSPLGLYTELGFNLEEVRDTYVDGYAFSYAHWIKTPSVVVSWSTDNETAVGGHNLDSRIVPFRTDATLRTGEFRVAKVGDERVVYLAGEDMGKINPRMLMEVERASTGLHTLGKRALNTSPPRPRPQVIPAVQRSGRGLQPNHIAARKVTSGIEINGKVVETHAEFIEEVAATLQKYKGEKKIEYRLEGFSEGEAQLSLKSIDIQLGFKTGKIKSSNIFEKITARDWELDKAVVQIAEGRNQVTLEITSRNAIVGKLKLTFSRLSRNIVDKIEGIINRVLGKCKQNSTLNFRNELFQELRKEGINPDDLIIDESFEGIIDASDVIIALLETLKVNDPTT